MCSNAPLRVRSTNPDVRCENGDPIGQILGQLEKISIDMVEPPINTIIGNLEGMINSAISWLGTSVNIPRLCIRTEANPERPGVVHCGEGLTPEQAAAVTQCEDENQEKWKQCFYQRVLTICGSGSLLDDFRALFDRGYESLEQLEQEFVEAFADSYDTLDPILKALLEAVELSESSGPDLEARKDICSTSAFASAMTCAAALAPLFAARAHLPAPRTGLT